MKKKFLLAIAGIMTLQTTTAFATSASRFDGITEQELEVAKNEVLALRNGLADLDTSLAQAREGIQARQKSGTIINGTAVVGSAIGLGIAGLGIAVNQLRGGNGAWIAGAIFGGIVTGVSSLVGLAGTAAKEGIDTKKTTLALMDVKDKVTQAIQLADDKKTIRVLMDLEKTLGSLEGRLKSYQKSEDNGNIVKILAEVAQAAGATMTLVQVARLGSEKALAVGSIVYTAGNIAQLLNYMNDSQADKVIETIDQVRAEIAKAATGLN